MKCYANFNIVALMLLVPRVNPMTILGTFRESIKIIAPGDYDIAAEEDELILNVKESRIENMVYIYSPNTHIRVLTLNDGEHQDSTLYRLEKNYVLQFRLGPSLFGKRVTIYCNYPSADIAFQSEQINKDEPEFIRNQYFALSWQRDEDTKNTDETSMFCEIQVKISGSFHYYFVCENIENKGPQGSGFFIVDPELRVGPGKGEKLSLDCVQCHTVLAKQLGPLSTWEAKLRVSLESGYNMIHFTPIQALGGSNSAYSLSDQLQLNPIFNEGPQEVSYNDVNHVISKMRTEWKVLSICDVVLNHTANESVWLLEHPECTYNCTNSPYLRPSCLLDAALHRLTLDTQQGIWESKGVPRQVTSEEHLNALRHIIHTEYLPKVNIPELYLCHVGNLVSEFISIGRNRVPSVAENLESECNLQLIPDPQYKRLKATVDMELALRLYNMYKQDCFDEDSRLKKCSEEFKKKLEQLNHAKYEQIQSHLQAAVENSIAGMRYHRVQSDGPKISDVSIKNPLVPRYFTLYGPPQATLTELEKQMYSQEGCFLMAHNGWVMDADPLQNFAAQDSNVYLRRELIAWGDSVKLKFGEKPEDCPFLWAYMKKYVEQTAQIFDGIRLDNCHSTPIPVAEYLLDAARNVKPDLYVVAELFTNSDQKDNIFVNRLGITSLIREAMSAWDSHELGRLVYRYGGVPVGAFQQPRVRPLVPSIAHALFLDLTHDNPSPIKKRSVFDLLPSTALVNMACCASGSNRGYDELVPHHIHVVDEKRQYTEWADVDCLTTENPRYVGFNSGIIAAKKALNNIHYRLGLDGFDQVFVDQMDPDVVAVTRHCPETHQSVVLVAFTAFQHPSDNASYEQRYIRPLRVEGVLDEVVLEASLLHVNSRSGGSRYTYSKTYVKDENYINGLSEFEIEMREHIQLQQSSIFERIESGEPNITQLKFKNFKPGSIVVIRVSLQNNVQPAISKLRNLISSFNDESSCNELQKIISNLTLADLNRVLYRCEQEERDDGKGIGAYNIPGFGPLVYCGLQGLISLLANIRPNNDLGHPLCNNLREGNWLLDYISDRLKVHTGTMELGKWLEDNLQYLKEIPRYLVPSYFDIIITGTYLSLLQQCYNLMSSFVKQGSTFVKALSLGSVQCGGVVHSANLPGLSPHLLPPVPSTVNEKSESIQVFLTLSAGLPHFSTGYMRNWGRDTFIALRGLFILTGRYQEARYHILAYAGCLRHGLIPNLLDGGKNARFNCRDAIWWWLHCIQSYVKEAPNGITILSDKVSRIFPQDDSQPFEPGQVDQPLYDVIQEALITHFQGLCFRERNAGRQIDAHMSDRGFNNQIGVHPETGFVFGGNESNCGTWMDKMGSSDKAGNRGKPATPRDGSAVELVGLCYSALSWLAKLYQNGEFPYGNVQRKHRDGSLTTWTYLQWADKIKTNFEKYFWIHTSITAGESRPDLIHRRGIYKDTNGASQPWTDFQLRSNFPIAMVVAPDIFNPQHAWISLKKAEEILLGPLGMKTLDPKDWAYHGYYDNSNDSDDPKVAHGFNYHQGPEWVWPLGWFLRARLYFSQQNGELLKTINSTRAILSRHLSELQTSIWRGLPELTNKNGVYCSDSARTQAWSMACILEVLHDLHELEEKQPIVLNTEEY